MTGLKSAVGLLCLAVGTLALSTVRAQAAPRAATPAQMEIEKACLTALQDEKRTWLRKPETFDVDIRTPKEGDVTARCRLSVQSGTPEGPALSEYTVLVRVVDLYILGVSTSTKLRSLANNGSAASK